MPLVNRRVWRACAGSPIQIPTLNCRVFYFPQGHLEQSFSPTSPPLLSNLALSKPLIPCRISAVQFLADSVTDEVYAELILVPLDLSSSNSTAFGFLKSFPRPLLPHEGVGTDDDDDDKAVVHAKVLTPSDANNSGGFSVPKSCADLIFPPLNYDAESPVQTLETTDIYGITWQFWHIYQGMRRRHLLTTGWIKLVNHKKLVAVVFMRNSRGETLIGVRRAVRFNTGGECARWREQIGGTTGDKEKEGEFSRSAGEEECLR